MMKVKLTYRWGHSEEKMYPVSMTLAAIYHIFGDGLVNMEILSVSY